MRYEQNNQLFPQRRRRDWISFLFPLGFLLIFAFTQSFAGLFTSLAIIALLWVLLGVDSSSARRHNTSLMQQPIASPYEPEAERPYEQGYLGTWNTGAQAQQVMAPAASQASPYQLVRQGSGTSGEGNRLAQLQLLGDLYHAGKLSEDEFIRQKKEILQDGKVREATETEAAPALAFELEYEEPPLPPRKNSPNTSD